MRSVCILAVAILLLIETQQKVDKQARFTEQELEDNKDLIACSNFARLSVTHRKTELISLSKSLNSTNAKVALKAHSFALTKCMERFSASLKSTFYSAFLQGEYDVDIQSLTDNSMIFDESKVETLEGLELDDHDLKYTKEADIYGYHFANSLDFFYKKRVSEENLKKEDEI